MRVLLLRALILCSPGLSFAELEEIPLDIQAQASVSIERDNHVEAFQCQIAVHHSDLMITVVPEKDEIPVFFLYRDLEHHRARYWVIDSGNSQLAKPWVESFDTRGVSIRTTLFDPFSAFHAYNLFVRSSDVFVSQPNNNQILFQQSKGTSSVRSQFNLDQDGNISEFTQYREGGRLKSSERIRQVALSNYGLLGMPRLPAESHTVLVYPDELSHEEPKPMLTFTSHIVISSADPLPVDFDAQAYIAEQTKGFKEVSKDYDALAAGQPTMTPRPTANGQQRIPPVISQDGPPLPSKGISGHFLIMGGIAAFGIGLILLLRGRKG